MRNKKILGKDVVSRASSIPEKFNEKNPNRKPKKKFVNPFSFDSYFIEKYSSTYKNKDKKKERVQRIIDETLKTLAEGMEISHSGVFISGVGYFCSFMTPNPIKIVGIASEGMKVYDNEATEGMAYWLTYFPPKSKTEAVRYWNFVYNREVKDRFVKRLHEGYGTAINLKQLHKKINIDYEWIT